MAERLDRAADLVRVTPRPGRPFHMLTCDGRDQVTAAVGRGGWAVFEEPLPVVLSVLVRRFGGGGTFADVGANTGYYALLAAAVDPGIRVDAFEPYPPVLATLRHNVAINRAKSVEVHGVALGAEPATARLYVPVADHGLVETSSSLNPSFTHSAVGEELDVDVTTLDEWYRRRADRPPTVLKIDVESLEADVIAGGTTIISRYEPLLVVELLPHADPGPLESLRQQLGYTDIRLRPHAAVLGPHVAADPDAWNHLWCPDRRVEEVAHVLDGVGLRVGRG